MQSLTRDITSMGLNDLLYKPNTHTFDHLNDLTGDITVLKLQDLSKEGRQAEGILGGISKVFGGVAKIGGSIPILNDLTGDITVMKLQDLKAMPMPATQVPKEKAPKEKVPKEKAPKVKPFNEIANPHSGFGLKDLTGDITVIHLNDLIDKRGAEEVGNVFHQVIGQYIPQSKSEKKIDPCKPTLQDLINKRGAEELGDALRTFLGPFSRG